MIKCAFCNKPIDAWLDPQSGGLQVDTKYWQGDGPDRKYFCDAKCSLAAHEKAKAVIKLLGENK